MNSKLDFVLIWVTPIGQSKGLIGDNIEFILVDNISRGWELPGGRIEEAEDYQQAAKRELLEETGIKLEGINASNFELYDEGVLVWTEVDRSEYPHQSWNWNDKCISEIKWWNSYPKMKSWDVAELDHIAEWVNSIN